MNTRRHPSGSYPATAGRALRPVLGVLGLLLLGWGSAAPARAEGGTINSARTGPVWVNAGETLHVVDGASITSDTQGVIVNGGTVNISGGTIHASGAGVLLLNGAVTISGGSISSAGSVGGALAVRDGMVNISGGSINRASAGSVIPSFNCTPHDNWLIACPVGMPSTCARYVFGSLWRGSVIRCWT